MGRGEGERPCQACLEKVKTSEQAGQGMGGREERACISIGSQEARGRRPPLGSLDYSCLPGHKSQEFGGCCIKAASDLNEDTGHLGFLSCLLEGQHNRPRCLLHSDEMCHRPRTCRLLCSWHVGSRMKGGLLSRTPGHLHVGCSTVWSEQATEVLRPQE